MIKETISVGITNNTNGEIPVSLFGNNSDPMDNSNANTQYQWDITGFSVTNETLILLEYNTTGLGNYSIVTTSFSGTSIQGIINALNNLNLGVFFTTTSGGNTYINSYNNTYSFGTLQIVNTNQTASLSYSMNLNLSNDQVDAYINAVLISTFTDPNISSGTIPVVAGDTAFIDFLTSVNPKGTRVFVYNITTGTYLFDTTLTNSGNLGYTWTILANNSYLFGMSDG